mgnify:CR=1 FL=1
MHAEHVPIFHRVGTDGVLLFEGLPKSEETIPDDRRFLKLQALCMFTDLLKQKRDALLIEFMGVMDETLRLSESLQKNVSEAQYSLTIAKAVDGAVAVRSASLATKGEIVVDMSGTKIMGVAVPVVTKGDSPIKSSFTRGYSVTGVSSRVDETADKFERILDVIIEYADIERDVETLAQAAEIIAVTQVDDKKISDGEGPVTKKLRAKFREVVTGPAVPEGGSGGGVTGAVTALSGVLLRPGRLL